MRYTHRFAFLLLVTLIATAIFGAFAALPSAAARTPRLTAEVGDFTGYFMPHGDAPRAFKGFVAIDLTTAHFSASGPVPVKPYGAVYAGRKYKMARINIAGDSLLFETVSLAGVTYKFSGKLLRPYNPNGPVLSGRLTKTVNGKTVAEAQMEFDIEEGD